MNKNNLKPLTFVLLAAGIPLCADGNTISAPKGGAWNLGLIYQGPSFSASFYNKDGQNITNFDSSRDLGLGKSSTGLGLGLDYEGRRFRLHLATYGQNYSGDQNIAQDVTVDGKLYKAGGRVQSQIKLRVYELDWTIKFYRWDEGYVGVDLGLVAWNMDVSAQGRGSVSGGPIQYTVASKAVTVPIPQLGLSVGYHFGSQVDARGYYHLLSSSGASYRRVGADLRYFPMAWLGFRLNFENEGFDVPKGSIDDNTALKIDKNGMGLGVIWRF